MKKILLLIDVILITQYSMLQAQTWTTVTPGPQGNCEGITLHNNQLFISTYAAGPYVSVDGTTWTSANNGMATYGNVGQGISSVGQWLYYGSKDGLYRSNDDGATWSLVNNGLQSTGSIISKAVFATYLFGSTYFCIYTDPISTGGGIYSSSDGINWTASSNGIAASTTVYQLVKLNGDLYACTNLELYKSVDNGANWSVVSPSGTKVYNGLYSHLGRWLIHTTFGMEYSDDNGATWDTLTSAIKSSTYCGFVPGANDTLYAYTSSNGVFYSVDTGATWVDITGNLTSNEIQFMSGMEYLNGKLYLSTVAAVKSSGTGSTSTDAYINEFENSVIKTYPNPFNDKLYIENKSSDFISVLLYDISGKLVLSKQSNLQKSIISTQHLPNGLYLLKIVNSVTGELITTKKIIK